jgi:predicted alpha-1,2-mannosidase
MHRILIPLLIFSLLPLCVISQEKLIDFVDPFIGTREMGHTYPGASVPFGMVQLSPDTDTIPYSYGDGYVKEVYRYCAGYQFNDPTITGFSHTHFSGTGHSDLGDFLVMPFTGKVQLNPGSSDHPESGYRSVHDKESEAASPGYYAVFLEEPQVYAELTATTRVGVHRYTFPEATSAGIILDMNSGIYNYPWKTIWASIRVENDTLITGCRQTRGWARDRKIFFAMSFSKPVTGYGFCDNEKVIYNGFYRKFNQVADFPEMAGRNIQAYFSFSTAEREQVVIKVALSAVSTEGAILNLDAEASDLDFDTIRLQAENSWEEELGKIKIEGKETLKRIFYTSLYHSDLSPTIYMDVDGNYRGLDQNIHQAEGFTNYTTFSLWDTYRALHPLFTIIQQERTSDMINSMLAHQGQSVHGILPVWSRHANENWCMIGYHAVPVIADAWMKGIRGFDGQKALQACLASAIYRPYDGIGYYMDYGYVPSDLNSNSASKTLEYAYDDWTIAKMAENLGQSSLAKDFLERASSFEFLFDLSTGFIHPKKSDGSWQIPFDPLSIEGQGFIEGNAWNYSLYIPHSPRRLIEFYGGNIRFIVHLDSLFTFELDEKHFGHSEDISKAGIIGNYVHGNEPSHHVPYLYVYAGASWKTQEKVHEIVKAMYRDAPDGLCGNDDCGQMSAWYIFSVLGFYPVCPGSNEYVIGTPSVSKAEISLENGNKFIILAENISDKNIYIQRIVLNGQPYKKLFIRHEDIMAGGELKFIMGPKLNKRFGDDNDSMPYSM